MNNTDYEPMDIDSSANSYTAMEISYNEISFEDPVKTKQLVENQTGIPYINREEIQKFHNRDMQLRKEKRNVLRYRLYLLVFLFVSVITSILCYKKVTSECCREIDFKMLKDALTSKVHGQMVAVDTFIRALEINVTSKILILYGGTGVGKTLSISTVLDKLLNFANIYHYTMPSFVGNYATHLKLGFFFCEKWFIIVDDLSVKDKHITPIIKEIIDNAENMKKSVTIILIYNCDNMLDQFVKCDNSFLEEVKQVFIDVKASQYFIRYLPLTEESLKQCIVTELEHRQIRNVDVNMFMKNFNVMHDGCKGVHTKIKSLTIL